MTLYEADNKAYNNIQKLTLQGTTRAKGLIKFVPLYLHYSLM
jgi:hypothetical protein